MLLRASTEQGAGKPRLHVYLGAAPGVGKTYAMLEEGHRLLDAGFDVVIGYVEPHGRAETEALIRDLEIIPRKPIAYRGIQLEELDVDAVIARRPQIALIDELAHRNAPGSRHRKRYQDVEEILAAGITVITTMNIQHLEGINDVIESITGVKVHETVPDRVLDDADVELVDLPPERLRERLETGKIYPPEQARRALANFFRQTNLTALRELALRRTAEGVEATLERFMLGESDEGAWIAIEHVLVCLGSPTQSEALIRHGWRLARGLRAQFTALVVIAAPLDDLPANQRDQLLEQFQVAEDLGAEVMTIVDSSVAGGIIRIARAEHVTDIVIGKPRNQGWKKLLGGTIIDELLRELPGVNIHLINSKFAMQL